MSMEGRERSRAHEENANGCGGAVERMEREMSLGEASRGGSPAAGLLDI